jgi:hypothetical protein
MGLEPGAGFLGEFIAERELTDSEVTDVRIPETSEARRFWAARRFGGDFRAAGRTGACRSNLVKP